MEDEKSENGLLVDSTEPQQNGEVNKEVENHRPSKCSKRAAKEQQALLKKKDERSIEALKKVLATTSSPEEKMQILSDKYAEVLEENRKLTVNTKTVERKTAQIQREKDQLQGDLTKVILARTRLESLCREIQRQNKQIKEETVGRIREEEEKRKELSARFNVTLNDITSLMQQNTEKNNQLRDENKALAEKFKTMCEQYELREKQVEKLFQKNQLESKITETRMAKAQLQMSEEKEFLLKEIASYQVQVEEMRKTEDALRGQVTMYSGKFDEFQNALGQSNDAFNTFKSEMERMTKKVGQLEKETSTWKSRWENSQKTLIELAADKQQHDQECALLRKQVNQLQKLCRTLQEERTKHLAQIRQLEGDDAVKSIESNTTSEDNSKIKQTADSNSLSESSGPINESNVNPDQNSVSADVNLPYQQETIDATETSEPELALPLCSDEITSLAKTENSIPENGDVPKLVGTTVPNTKSKDSGRKKKM